MIVLLASAFAATVAVLPLQHGAGGPEYDGLGAALSGMLTTDLSAAPGVTLVERAQLDAVTGEIALGKGGFIDPSTAQSLGKGVGAQYVVLGSYSVVGDTFLLDARLVDVASGKVAKAADAKGTVDGFVDVEKTLVGSLLAGLSVTLSEPTAAAVAKSPTRSFDALVAYGAGQAAEKRGDWEAARAAYATALTADPLYAAPVTSLGALRTQLDDAAAARHAKEKGSRAALLDRILAAHPFPTSATDPTQRAGIVLRLVVLAEAGRDCQRAEEMLRYLELTGWKVERSPSELTTLFEDTLRLAEADGYAPKKEDDGWGRHDAETAIQTRGTWLFKAAGRYFYDFPTARVDVPASADLTTTLSRCLTPPELLAELSVLGVQVRVHGLAGVRGDELPAPLAERLEWSALAVKARTTGVDEAMAARLTSLVARYDDTTPSKALHGKTERAWAEGEAKRILDDGLLVARKQAAKLGWRDPAIAEALDALAAHDPKRVAVKDTDCSLLLTNLQPWATATKAAKPSPSTPAMLTALRDLGCFTATKARFAKPSDAAVYVADAPRRAVPAYAATKECSSAMAELPKRLDPGTPMNAQAALELLTWYHAALEGNLCVAG